jgi:hypothetical protein
MTRWSGATSFHASYAWLAGDYRPDISAILSL